MEILGAVVVDLDVLEQVGIGSAEWGGFAFGVGIERVVVLRHRISNIRMLRGNDVRFLTQLPG